jgi:hypothetical protein
MPYKPGDTSKKLPPLEFKLVPDSLPVPRVSPRRSRYLFSIMDIGDCALVNRPYQHLAAAALAYRQKPGNEGKRFAIRKVDARRCKIWRLA